MNRLMNAVRKSYQFCGERIGVKPKRYEAVGIALIAAAAIFEVTIANNNTRIIESKFEGVVERLDALASSADYVADCAELKINCGNRKKTVLHPESYSDQAIPFFYQSGTEKAAKFIAFCLGTVLLLLGRWFDGYKRPDSMA